MRAEQTSFLFGANAPFIEELYERYLGDPNAVDAEWRTFFEALGEQKSDVLAEVRGASARMSSAPSIPKRCRPLPTAT
jgi:2-oxoglutarate dehydrogenase E1 component